LALGNALSKTRKVDAEYGTSHRIARKLAALFESMVPEAQRLVAAYRKRAIGIIETPGLNPLETFTSLLIGADL
jgi:hypothetical protein